MNLIATPNKDDDFNLELQPPRQTEPPPEAHRRCFKSSDDFTDLIPSSKLFLCHGSLALLRTADLMKIVERKGCLLLDVLLPKVFEIAQR